MSVRTTNAGDVSASAESGFLAIDVGSSCVKLGWFPPPGECSSQFERTLFPVVAPKLPQPEATLAVSHCGKAELKNEICEWLEHMGARGSQCFVASVHPDAMARIEKFFSGPLQILSNADLPIEVRVDHPERVGIDRLLDAMAVNRLRQPKRSAIVVDLGTACTVDLISSGGAFEGGAIFPGTPLSAASLHSGTATLPQLVEECLDSPPAVVGKSTQQAISSGLYWGLVGAVRELVDRISLESSEVPQLFVTGGGATRLASHFMKDAESSRYIPNLVLAGIAIVANDRATEERP